MNQQQTQSRTQQLASKASALFDQADAEGRQLTPEERAVAKDKVGRFRDLRASSRSSTSRAGSAPPASRTSPAATVGGTAGGPFRRGPGVRPVRGLQTDRRPGDAGPAVVEGVALWVRIGHGGDHPRSAGKRSGPRLRRRRIRCHRPPCADADELSATSSAGETGEEPASPVRSLPCRRTSW
jgi:hypothetical protein